MAKIYGVQLKAIRTFEGMEGYGVDANIYIDNKKVGRFYDAGNGGCTDVDIYEASYRKILKERADKYFKMHPVDKTGFDESNLEDGQSFEERYSFMTDANAFMEEVYSLAEKEKTFKKYMKQGYKLLLSCNYPFFASGPIPYIPDTVFGGSDPLRSVNEFVREKKTIFPLLTYKVYSTLDDFIIEDDE